jgi:hypothetical protein
MAHAGRCLCGQAHYTIHAEPIGARMCWCRDCQRIASGSPTVNVLFPVDAVNFAGEIAFSERIADSGNRVRRGFCPKCGSQVYSRSIDHPALPIRIRAGTLDNPDLIAPEVIIFTDSAPKWAHFNPDLPQYPGALPAAPVEP